MKKSDIPQDDSKLVNFTKELCYAKNEQGEYEKVLSSGWEIKSKVLDDAWEAVEERIENARVLVYNKVKSPIFYFMELNLMDLPTLSAYTGFWKFSIKRHMKPEIFQKLSNTQLEKYAKAFKIAVADLKSYDGKN